jgi:hypothetical protein
MAAAAAQPAPARSVAGQATLHASGFQARTHETPPPSDVAADHQGNGMATMTIAPTAAAILVLFLLLGARGQQRHRARPRPFRPARPIAVPPRPG